MARTVTLAYSNHRPETLPHAEPIMEQHDAVILEEPPTTAFRSMLDGEQRIDAYLEQVDFEYPEFARRSCSIFRRLHARGVSIYQTDPYLELLGKIHDLFDAGGSPRDVADDPHLGQVYAAERKWTAALIAFYGSALSAPFEDVVRSVAAFARTDAARGRVRDALRVRAILEVIPEHESVYVEAGTLHLALLQELLRGRPCGTRVRVRHLMQPVVHELGGRCRGLGPGDLLTMMLTARPDLQGATIDLLAARSLIYNRIVHHEEMTPGDDPHPHTRDEVEASRLVELLGYRDCVDLYRQVKAMPRLEARALVQGYVDG
jgi:hypothetical protein